jgi:hypothetical protein
MKRDFIVKRHASNTKRETPASQASSERLTAWREYRHQTRRQLLASN